jgi:hypothetical protein
MATPYNGKILLVTWCGVTTPGASADKLAQLIRAKMPNVAGVMLKTSNGVSWQGQLSDNDPKAVTGVTRIQEWVDAFSANNLEVHVWGVPRAKRPAGAAVSPDITNEAKKFISAARVPGVKSLLLDVEKGDFYWLGTPDEARDLMTQIRAEVPAGTHIGLILDGRRNRPFEFWVEPWLPFVNSLHPMVYPNLFDGSKTIEQHLDEAFQSLMAYGKPIVPMLQAFGEAGRRPTPDEVTRQGNAAFARQAAGISYFRLSSDVWSEDGQPHMGEPEYAAIAAVTLPGSSAQPVYTWQMVINAVYVVALRVGEDYSQWLDGAGFWTLFTNASRGQPYSGLAIANWPMPANRRAQILDLLEHNTADELVQLAVQAAGEREQAEKNDAAEQRRQFGSIVGIHGAPGCAAPPPNTWNDWIAYLKEMGVKWYKQCDDGQPAIMAWVQRLKQEGIEPIIRYLVTEQFPDRLPDQYFDWMKKYVQAGIVWAEIGNEPNLDIEWKSEWRDRPDKPVSHTNPEAIQRIAETWLADAQRALTIGARPAFYAFGGTDWHGAFHPQYSSVFFTQKVVAYLAQHHRAETIAAFQQGAWLAVHVATFEQPCDFDPFRPDGTIWDMTLRGYEVVLKAFRDNFGGDLDQIVVMSTEGGVFTPDSTSMFGHERLHSDDEHARRVVEMYRWLERNSPLKAMCPWCLSVGNLIGHFDTRFRFDGWIEEINGQLRPRPVYDALRQLRFDHAREEESLSKALGPIKLSVPYISQFDPTAGTHSGDCGPTCLAMILNAAPNGRNCTVDQLYAAHLPAKPAGEFTSLSEMIGICTAEGVPMQRLASPDGAQALATLHDLVGQNKPFVVLVNYAKWDDVAQNNFNGGHFVVVTGCDDQAVFVHDPLFRGARRNLGEHFVWRNEKFLEGWGSCHENGGNPDFVALVPDKQVARV